MIREVENSFLDFPGNNCFACHPNNNHGLKLKFYADDDKQEVFTRIQPEHHFNGFPGILHGGVQCALIDEVAYWAMFDRIKKIGLTAKIDLNFLKPVPMDTELVVSGKVINREKRRVAVETVIKDGQEDILTRLTSCIFFLTGKLCLRFLARKTLMINF